MINFGAASDSTPQWESIYVLHKLTFLAADVVPDTNITAGTPIIYKWAECIIKEDMGIVYDNNGTLKVVLETCCSQKSGPEDSPAIEETKTSC